MAQTAEFNVQIRLPRSVSQGEVVEIKAKVKHVSRTGLQLVETAESPFERFVRNAAAEFVRKVEVFYDGELISTFEMNATTSDDPLLTFMLKADKEAPLTVVATNHLMETAEATENLVFTA